MSSPAVPPIQGGGKGWPEPAHVRQALLGFHSEHRWIHFAICHLRGCFPYLPHQPGYNKRLRAALPLVKQTIRDLAADSDFWSDTVWVADSTSVECGRSRPAVRRSDMAGWANYGYCASHSRWFWGLRLYLICTPAGMPILWALADPKIGEREALRLTEEAEALTGADDLDAQAGGGQHGPSCSPGAASSPPPPG